MLYDVAVEIDEQIKVPFCAYTLWVYKEDWANRTFKTNHTSLSLTYIFRSNVKGNRKYSNDFTSTTTFK